MEDERILNAELEDEFEGEVDNEEESNPNETKNEKFIRLAEGRMTKLLSFIRKLDNLSNRNNYEYSDEQVEQMFSAIESELAEVKANFMKSSKENKAFKFR